MDDKDISQKLDVIIAQNALNRKLKIKKVTREFNREQKLKMMSAIATGICVIGTAALIRFSGQDPNAAIQSVIESLSSVDSLKEYLSQLTPAMYISVSGAVASILGYLKHSIKSRKIFEDLEDLGSQIIPGEDISNGNNYFFDSNDQNEKGL